MNEAYNNLVWAIIRQAIADYNTARRSKNVGQMLKIEKFFRGEWYAQLCDVDGEYVISHLKEAKLKTRYDGKL